MSDLSGFKMSKALKIAETPFVAQKADVKQLHLNAGNSEQMRHLMRKAKKLMAQRNAKGGSK